MTIELVRLNAVVGVRGKVDDMGHLTSIGITCALCDDRPHVQIGVRPSVQPPADSAAYALRTATGQYRTTPLRGLWQHAPYFHDGSAPDLVAVMVNHYIRQLQLKLTRRQKADLVEFLKSL